GSWASRGGFVGPRIDAPWLSRIGWGAVGTPGWGRPRPIEAPPFRLAKLIVVACRVHANGSQPQRECQKICRFIVQTAHRWAPPQIQGGGETLIVPGMAGLKVRSFRGRAARRAAGGVTIPFSFDPAEAWGRRDRYHVTGTIEGLGFRTALVHQSTWQFVLGL